MELEEDLVLNLFLKSLHLCLPECTQIADLLAIDRWTQRLAMETPRAGPASPARKWKP
jgi:hypothetical protein